MINRAELDSLQPGDKVVLRPTKNAKNSERVLEIVRIEAAGGLRKLHFNDGTFWPETTNIGRFFHTGYRRSWIGKVRS